MPGARRASRRRSVIVVIVLTCLTLITLDSRNGRSGPIGTLGGIAHRIVSPVQSAVDDVASPISDWWAGVSDSGNLKKRNRDLEEQIAKLKGQQSAAAQAINENTDLKALLQLSDALLVKHVNAIIIATGIGNFDPTLTIDRGSDSGIAVDMPVLAPVGIVGKVIQVYKTSATIQVVTDPDFAVGVTTPAHPGSPPTVGAASAPPGSSELSVTLAAGTKVRVGDPIVTSAQSTLFPAGLSVGTVTKVMNQPGDTGVVALIKPYVDIPALQHLTVLLWAPGTPGPVLSVPTTTTTTTTTTSTTTVPNSGTTVFGATTTTTVSTSSTTKPGG